jgi:hypothetical protein
MTEWCPRKGVHIMLCGTKHILGHVAKEEVCRFNSPNVSVNNCTISWRAYDANGKIQPPNHKFKPGDYVMVCIKNSRYCPLFFTTPQSIAFINTTLVRCICVIVARVGFLVLKLQWDFKKYLVNVLNFFGRIWKPRNNLSFPTSQMEHLLTTKSFKRMVQKLNSNMEILCHLLVHHNMVNLYHLTMHLPFPHLVFSFTTANLWITCLGILRVGYFGSCLYVPFRKCFCICL